MSDTTTPLSRIDDDISRFFVSLGYTVDWDFQRSTGQSWYEILKDGRLVAQIDKGVPLQWIIEDLTCFHGGQTVGVDRGDDKDYAVSGPEGPDMTELFARVAAKNPITS